MPIRLGYYFEIDYSPVKADNTATDLMQLPSESLTLNQPYVDSNPVDVKITWGDDTNVNMMKWQEKPSSGTGYGYGTGYDYGSGNDSYNPYSNYVYSPYL